MVFAMDLNNKAETFDGIADVDMSKENSIDYNHDITMEYVMPKLDNNNLVIKCIFFLLQSMYLKQIFEFLHNNLSNLIFFLKLNCIGLIQIYHFELINYCH